MESAMHGIKEHTLYIYSSKSESGEVLEKINGSGKISSWRTGYVELKVMGTKDEN